MTKNQVGLTVSVSFDLRCSRYLNFELFSSVLTREFRPALVDWELDLIHIAEVDVVEFNFPCVDDVVESHAVCADLSNGGSVLTGTAVYGCKLRTLTQ